MTLKSDGAGGLKNGIQNLVNFPASIRMSENLRFYGLLASDAF